MVLKAFYNDMIRFSKHIKFFKIVVFIIFLIKKNFFTTKLKFISHQIQSYVIKLCPYKHIYEKYITPLYCLFDKSMTSVTFSP